MFSPVAVSMPLSFLHCLSFSSSISMSLAILSAAHSSLSLVFLLSSLILCLSAISLSFFSFFWNSSSSASLLIRSLFSVFLLSSSSRLSKSSLSFHFLSSSSFHELPLASPDLLHPGHGSSPFSLQWVQRSALNSLVKLFLTLFLLPPHFLQGINSYPPQKLQFLLVSRCYNDKGVNITIITQLS